MSEIGQYRSPIHQVGDKWFFWDESWCDKHGPFDSRAECRVAMDHYCITSLGFSFKEVVISQEMDPTLSSRAERGEGLEKDAARFEYLLDDPETARHFFLLLSQKKGTKDDLKRMIDRVRASRDAALQAAREAGKTKGKT